MRCVYLDRADAGHFTVRTVAGISTDRTKPFANYEDAAAYAEKQMGRKGMVIDTTKMTAEQLAAHKAREARARALLTEWG